MKQHINLEDSIFVINIRIRMIQDTLLLDTDAELFLAKTLDDLNFIDSCLSRLLANLEENSRLIERTEQFCNLAETEQQFCEILQRLDSGEGNISALRYPELKERTASWRDRSRGRQLSIERLITESKQEAREPVVGQNELQELLGR